MFDNDDSTAHLRNAPTRDYGEMAAAEPNSYRKENEIPAGRARISFKKHVRPATTTMRHGLVIASAPSVSIRSSNMPMGANPDAYRYSKPQTFLDGGVGDALAADSLPGMCGIDKNTMIGAAVVGVVAWLLLKG